MQPVIILHYNEIALKGGNREWFERQLIENVRWAVRDIEGVRVQRMSGRIAVFVYSAPSPSRSPSYREGEKNTVSPLHTGRGGEGGWGPIAERLKNVFGIANIQMGYEVRQGREELVEDVVEVVRCHCERSEAERGNLEASERDCHVARALAPRNDAQLCTFAVRAKRSDKSFPENSQELERRLGAAIVEATGLGVDLEHPDLTVAVEIVEDTAFVLLERVEGPGGLPVGVSGRVLTLLSSGFDSPVAAWRMMKRGCVSDFIHFHSYPYTSDASIRNVEEIVRVLQSWEQGRGTIHLVPLIEYQKVIMMSAPAPLRVLLYRRMMFRVAEAIARKIGAEALATGENLGQVASQTIPNMAAVEAVATLPVFRPLLGYDKMEIIRQAEAIGTAAISSRPYDDCCSLFTPQHPATRTTATELDAAEASLEVGEWVERLLAQVYPEVTK